MNIQDFAHILDGCEMGKEMNHEQAELARELGFVVVFGYSDDGAEIRGAINDEVGCFSGGTIYLDGNRLLEKCDCECSYYQEAKNRCKLIEIVWHDEGEYCWTYETDIPHAIFEIMEDGEKYCRGIVFDVKSLGEEAKC